MPNHIQNRLTVISGAYDLSKFKSFNDVIPMPEEIKDTSHDGFVSDVERMLGVTPTYFGKRLTLPELLQAYPSEEHLERVRYLINLQLTHGAVSWYHWSVNNWGTKWNMYEVSCEDNILTFQTAWSAPIPVYKSLAKELPNGVVIKVEWADEDIGRNVGELMLSNKDCLINAFDNESDEAYSLAIDLNNAEGYFKKIDGEWVCTDE